MPSITKFLKEALITVHEGLDSLFAGREEKPDKVECWVADVGRVVRLELRVFSGVGIEQR